MMFKSTLFAAALGLLLVSLSAQAAVEVSSMEDSFIDLSYPVSSGEPQSSLVPGSSDAADAYSTYDTPHGYASSADAMVAPVPEPKGWMMILAGLGLVGVMIERAKRRAV